mmetsp:Transcript_87597/g.272224  ORF Transcript_87597/g.272224 Transcript_87597/m.272224 type:complete len:170 (+) Transcript_87597:1-510(+)
MASLSGSGRGIRLEGIARAVDAMIHRGASIEKVGAQTSRTLDVARRNTACDWTRDGRRIECKSAKLCWQQRWLRWTFSFYNIKLSRDGDRLGSFDELQLVLYTPRGIFIYLHDLRLGLTSKGKSTLPLGYIIQLYGPVREHCWSLALDVMLAKLDRSGCRRLAFVPWNA